MTRLLLVLAVLAGGAVAAHASDPASFGGGACHQMAEDHDPADLWVGRFAGIKDGAGGRSPDAVACFTDHEACMRWVTAQSGGTAQIISMSCHRGT